MRNYGAARRGQHKNWRGAGGRYFGGAATNKFNTSSDPYYKKQFIFLVHCVSDVSAYIYNKIH